MTIGSMMLELFIPASQSLKDKRRVVRSIKDRLHSRYNVAVAEVDHQETHQRARLGVVGITTERLQLEQLFDSIRVDVERNLPGDLVQAEIEILR